MAESDLELWQGLAPVLDAFDRLGVDWYVGGSVASSTLGVARATQDVDVIASLAAGHAGPLASMLSPDYFADEAMIASAIRRRASFNLVHLATMLKVDVFVHRDTPFARSEMERRQLIALPGADRAVHVASVEDLILQKLAWYRDGGGVSERQWLDVQGLMRLNDAQLDREHLDRWAGTLGVSDLLARALSEAGLGRA